MRPFQLSEIDQEKQKRRFLTPDEPLCFLVVTAKLMTGFGAPNEGVAHLPRLTSTRSSTRLTCWPSGACCSWRAHERGMGCMPRGRDNQVAFSQELVHASKTEAEVGAL